MLEHPHNLPRQLNSFVGRERSIAEIRRLLATARLLTLVGPGGIGKTRLALEVADGLLADYPDGIWLVELAPLIDPGLVMRTVARIVGVREQAGQPLNETLTEALRPRLLMLVLDNCEHLIGACAELADALLRGCPNLQILATSREAMSVVGETILRIQGMVMPASPGPGIEATEAVQLFSDRAAAIMPGFVLTDQNAPAVIEVCRQVDGIPLAIELAAAQMRALTPAQLAERISDRFHLLKGHVRTLAPRQQTLLGTLAWSYDLLSEQERTLFTRLSVFANGWTLEAAEAVCSDDRVDGETIVGTLTRLVDKSLVVFEPQPDGSGRYRLLETIRQYSLELLTACGEVEILGERHARCFLGRAEEIIPNFWTREQASAGRRLEVDLDNFRAALAWWIERSDVKMASRLVYCLSRFWMTHGFLGEARAWLARVQSLPGLQPVPDGARLWNYTANISWIAGDFAATQAAGEASLALSREFGLRDWMPDALWLVGFARWAQGDDAGAQAAVSEGLALSRELGQPGQETNSLTVLAEMAWGMAEYAVARTYAEEAQRVASESGILMVEAGALRVLGWVRYSEGDRVVAQACWEAALRIYHALGTPVQTALIVIALAWTAMDADDLAGAFARLRDALEVARHLGNRLYLARTLEGFAGLAAACGSAERALRLVAGATGLRMDAGIVRVASEQQLLDHRLGGASVELRNQSAVSADAHEQAMSLDDLIADALVLDIPGPNSVQRRQRAVREPGILTAREREVAALIAKGRTNRQVAKQLVIAVPTAERHVANILGKLGFTSRTQIAIWASHHDGQT